MVVIDTLDVCQGEGVAHGAEGAAVETRHVVVVGALVAEVIRFGTIEPEGIDALAHQSRVEVLPVAVARLGIVAVIGSRGHVRGVALDGDEASSPPELGILSRLRSEVGPDGDHQLGVHGMHLVDHALVVGIVRVQELHGVPVVVVAPILPVLHDAVEGHLVGTVLADDVDDLLCAHVALLALVESEVPYRRQLGAARQMAPLAQHILGVVAHEHVVIDGLPGGGEGGSIGGIGERSRRIVVPIEGITLRGVEVRNVYAAVVLNHIHRHATHGQASVLQLSEAVDVLVGIQAETLLEAE